ncbi:MAG TPA: signal peptidase II [Lachnospiraceae bacterium]|nr:signal peptidase II [Lachnospiraceae bacterium]
MKNEDKRGNKQKIVFGLLLIFCLTALDQLTKYAAAKTLANGPIELIPGVFRLEYLENTGAAFGILKNAQWFFVILMIAFITAAWIFYTKIPVTVKYRPLRLVLLFVTSGAAGNLIDRIFLHHVRDFLYFSLINFPIFNVADIYVTLSAIAAFILVIFVYKDDDLHFLKNHPAEKTNE